MSQRDSSQEEEAFRKALNKTDLRGALQIWMPILGSGIVAFGALLATYTLWPLNVVPLFVLFGVPLIAGAAAFSGIKWLL